MVSRSCVRSLYICVSVQPPKTPVFYASDSLFFHGRYSLHLPSLSLYWSSPYRHHFRLSFAQGLTLLIIKSIEISCSDRRHHLSRRRNLMQSRQDGKNVSPLRVLDVLGIRVAMKIRTNRERYKTTIDFFFSFCRANRRRGLIVNLLDSPFHEATDRKRGCNTGIRYAESENQFFCLVVGALLNQLLIGICPVENEERTRPGLLLTFPKIYPAVFSIRSEPLRSAQPVA